MRNFFDLKQVAATPGQVVRAFRTNFRLTLKELEKITGISESNLSAIENDKTELGVRRAELLAAAFGISPAAILFPEGFKWDESAEIRKVRERAKKVAKHRIAEAS